jgi:hypothetical protein
MPQSHADTGLEGKHILQGHLLLPAGEQLSLKLQLHTLEETSTPRLLHQFWQSPSKSPQPAGCTFLLSTV